jgi:predicted PolB exonuclease-like 3'-5' exonuclease
LIKIKDFRSGGKVEASEYELVYGFFTMISNKLPRLVSFNGKTFDIPVLKYRALKHKISIPKYYNAGDKWSSYSSKYGHDWHCDLIDALSDYGSSSRVKLNEVCAMFGIPGKFDMDGSEVEQYYKNGDLEKIRNYCELDVASTFLVYLNWALHTGATNRHCYEQTYNQFVEIMQEKSQSQAVFGEFIKRLEQYPVNEVAA